MNREFRGNHKRSEGEPGRDHLFLWTVGILLLIGATLTVWLGSFYIFGHPERPTSYRLLQRLNKIEPPQRFALTKAPAGDFLNAKKAFERYSTLTGHEMKLLNEALLRDYIRNYQHTKRSVPYITGRFTILDSYELKESDFFGTGVVAVAQSVEMPQLIIEHVYTAPKTAIPILQQMLATGLNLQLERLTDLAAVVNIARTPDGRLQLTVVPLLYGSYALQQGRGKFSLEPPASLNPASGLPVVKEELFTQSVENYNAFVQKRTAPASPGGTPTVPVARPVADTTIVRVDSPEPPPSPGGTLATPEPGAPSTTPAPEPASLAEATPAQLVDEEEPTSLAQATPLAQATATIPIRTPGPSPTPALEPPRPVVAAATPLLQPFLAASPTPGAARPSTTSWRTYPPGRMPRGRLVSLSDADELAERGTGGERTYLRGNFVVTASEDNRAILRSSNRIGNVLNSVTQGPRVRVIVEFPSGSPVPSERSRVSRDEMRPFEIRDIQRGADGEVNLFVREVTNP